MWGSEQERLEELALLYGVQTSYRDVDDETQRPPPEALSAVLRALGASLDSAKDLDAAVTSRRLEECGRLLPPVALAPGPLLIRLPLPEPRLLELRLRLENGVELRRRLAPEELPLVETYEVAGRRYNCRSVPLEEAWTEEGRPEEAGAGTLPWGYHRLEVSAGALYASCLVISAPPRCWGPDPDCHRAWGAFLPLYALQSKHSLGIGDLGDLRELISWVRRLGGETVGTLPLLAAFLDEPFEPSPYSPVTRLFFNELYLDLRVIPELEISPAARRLLAEAGTKPGSPLPADAGTKPAGGENGWGKEADPARLVDYREVARIKGSVLGALTQTFFAESHGARREAFTSFLRARPDVEEYARFRATAHREGRGWPGWSRPLRPGQLRPEHYDDRVRRFHLYVQWLLEEQLQAAVGDDGGRLYLDLPLGVNGGGYDTWREAEVFAQGASGGAPPDTFFAGGQNWGFPPLHPHQLREQGYRYFIASLRAQMRFARYLRIDHVMGLHRLFWVPEGFTAKEGTYVTYPAEELYAVLCLESHRAQTIVLGEDLGTVPEYVRPAMRAHAVRSMYVLSYELNAEEAEEGERGERGEKDEETKTLPPVPSGTVASLNTHDMPPFAGFLTGQDVAERRATGHLENGKVEAELTERKRLLGALAKWLEQNRLLGSEPGPAEADEIDAELYLLLRGALRYLAGSPAELVLVNLEDLMLERLPQNVPGTSDERPNWRLRAAATLEDLREMQEVREALTEVNYLRNEQGKGMEPT